MTMMDIVVIEVKLGLLVSMEENMGLVPLVDISIIDQNLMEICFLNLGEIEVNLELHQNEKALHLVKDQALVTLGIVIHLLELKVFIHRFSDKGQENQAKNALKVKVNDLILLVILLIGEN
ncbi:hypothetical protein Goshw_000729 [Gossypium schwendimanii]|uniref:Uncharacterized protein n=1 Tax=Gossypium schwendimanii TaxID=34291 RepID=A0A7J9KIR2_GOSSC|nr:hypothetical protein [Gossypium schwendimanii]